MGNPVCPMNEPTTKARPCSKGFLFFAHEYRWISLNPLSRARQAGRRDRIGTRPLRASVIVPVSSEEETVRLSILSYMRQRQRSIGSVPIPWVSQQFTSWCQGKGQCAYVTLTPFLPPNCMFRDQRGKLLLHCFPASLSFDIEFDYTHYSLKGTAYKGHSLSVRKIKGHDPLKTSVPG